MSNLVINTNVMALNAHRNMGRVSNEQSRASQRLSSGLRINSSADDAAGLAITQNMRTQINGLSQGARNAQDGISLVQTAEAGLAEMQNIIQRTRELIIQAANDTNTANDRAMIGVEINQLAEEIIDMRERVQFNTMNILDNYREEFVIHVGPNGGQNITLNFEMDLVALDWAMANAFNIVHLSVRGNPDTGQTNEEAGFITTLRDGSPVTIPLTDGQRVVIHHGPPPSDVTFFYTMSEAISSTLEGLDNALMAISQIRAGLGASQNRIEFTINAADISAENLSAAASRIRDADMGAEMMTMTAANVLQQAAMSMLAQANQSPQSILQLL